MSRWIVGKTKKIEVLRVDKGNSSFEKSASKHITTISLGRKTIDLKIEEEVEVQKKGNITQKPIITKKIYMNATNLIVECGRRK